MPSNLTLARSPRRSRLLRAAAIALASCATATATATAEGRLVPMSTPVASSTSDFNDLQATKADAMRALGRHLARNRATQHPCPGSHYFDLEANKANSMRAFGLHLAGQRTSSTSRHDDLQANKEARNARARWLRAHGSG